MGNEQLNDLSRVEVIIPVIDSTLPFCLKYVVPSLQKNVKISRIVLLGRADLKNKISDVKVDFQDEDTIYPQMTLSNIRDVLETRNALGKRAGWYFQQFLKMAWAYKTTEKRYLVWDSDTIPLHELCFFDGEKILFNEKIEYHEPYFQTIKNLFNGRMSKQIKGSFIAEHMVMDTGIMQQMLADISANPHLQGNNFWEKILYAVPDSALSHSGFSEFETYGNYALTVSDLYHPRVLRSLRAGRVFLGTSPSKRALQDTAEFYDLVSIENPKKRFGFVSKLMPMMTKILRMCFVPLPMIVRMYIRIRKTYFRIRFHEALLDLE